LLEFRRRRLGFVFQAFHLLPHLTALQNVSIPSLLAGASTEMAAFQAREMLASLGMSHRADGLPGELSGGEQQRVALARALAHRPGLVLADEPTGNLDPHTARRALDSLCETCRECGAALLMVTHSPEAAGRLDRSLLLTADGLLESSPSR
jgi:putative ABC transport system ATP-binding protein